MENIKFYKKNFLTAGIVSYDDVDDGVLLLKKETIDKALNTFKDKPVIITHDGTEPVGKVIDCYYDAETANYICIFYVDKPEAINLLDNMGQSISCTYYCLDFLPSGTYHNIPYDKEANNISFINLAIVDKPRYQEAKEYINSVEDIKENGGYGSGRKGHKTIRPVKIDGRKKFKDYKDLSKQALRFYKENIQNKPINKDLIGKIDFLKTGIRETINKGNPKYIFKLKDIIETGKVEKPETAYKDRKDKADKFDVITNKVKHNKKIKNVIVKIRNRNIGGKTKKDFYLIRDNGIK